MDGWASLCASRRRRGDCRGELAICGGQSPRRLPHPNLILNPPWDKGVHLQLVHDNSRTTITHGNDQVELRGNDDDGNEMMW